MKNIQIIAGFMFFSLMGGPLYPCAQILARIHYNIFDSSLSLVGERKLLEELRKDLNSDDEERVISAIEELAQLRTEAAARSLAAALKDPRYGVQMAALQSLREANSNVIPLVAELLDSSDRETQFLAVQAMGELGSEAIPYLTKSLINSNEELVRLSVKALGRIGGWEAYNNLEMMMNHPSWGVVQQVFESLREMDFYAHSTIQKGLYHERSSVRALAAETLGLRGDPMALEMLDRKRRDKEAYVRKRVIEAIGNIGDLKGLPILYDVLNSASDEEKTIAAGAIERIANQLIVNETSGQNLWKITKAFHSLREASESIYPKLAQAAKSARQLIQSKLIKMHPLEYWGAIEKPSPSLSNF